MKSPDRHEVTSLLRRSGKESASVVDEIVPLLYDELKAVAHYRLGQLRPGETVNTTGLVHEAYLRLVNARSFDWQDRGHFLAVASKTMRRILLNYARDRLAKKRGGGAHKVPLSDEEPAIAVQQAQALVDMNDLMEHFERAHPRPAAALAHRYFGGLQNDEIAVVLEVSVKTVERDLRFGRAWIARQWNRDLETWPVQ
jgi:RNA polymerase sigma factor (TIGR02999 family)